MDYDILPIEACRCHTNGHVANGNLEPDVNLIAQFSHASSSSQSAVQQRISCSVI